MGIQHFGTDVPAEGECGGCGSGALAVSCHRIERTT